jgi:hypothetical protein
LRPCFGLLARSRCLSVPHRFNLPTQFRILISQRRVFLRLRSNLTLQLLIGLLCLLCASLML